MYRDPPRPPPVGVTVGGDGGDALNRHNFLITCRNGASEVCIGIYVKRR